MINGRHRHLDTLWIYVALPTLCSNSERWKSEITTFGATSVVKDLWTCAAAGNVLQETLRILLRLFIIFRMARIPHKDKLPSFYYLMCFLCIVLH